MLHPMTWAEEREEDAKWERQAEIERRTLAEAADLSVRVFSRFPKRGDEQFSAELLDRDGDVVEGSDWTDDLDALMQRMRTRRDAYAERPAKESLDAVEA